MPCENCPGVKVEGAIQIVYTGGPAHAPYVLAQHAIQPEIVHYHQPAVRPDGCIEYDNHGGTTPPCPEGYRRDPANPWLLCPVWPSCVFRMLHCRQADDGSLNIEGRCLSIQSGRKANEALTQQGCEQCLVKEPIV
jgi:hypothetical protein